MRAATAGSAVSCATSLRGDREGSQRVLRGCAGVPVPAAVTMAPPRALPRRRHARARRRRRAAPRPPRRSTRRPAPCAATPRMRPPSAAAAGASRGRAARPEAPHRLPAVHHTVRGTYGTRGRCACGAGTLHGARERAALCLWYVQHGRPGRTCQHSAGAGAGQTQWLCRKCGCSLARGASVAQAAGASSAGSSKQSKSMQDVGRRRETRADGDGCQQSAMTPGPWVITGSNSRNVTSSPCVSPRRVLRSHVHSHA